MLTTVYEVVLPIQSDNLPRKYLVIVDITRNKHKMLCEVRCTKRCCASHVFSIFSFRQRAPHFVNGMIGLEEIKKINSQTKW